MKCPKCKITSGDDWSQCGDDCPMPMSPYYKGNSMSKGKLHAFEIKMKDDTQNVMVGHNTELWMDGVMMKGVTKVAFSLEVDGVAKLSIEVCGKMKISGRIEDLNVNITEAP